MWTTNSQTACCGRIVGLRKHLLSRNFWDNVQFVSHQCSRLLQTQNPWLDVKNCHIPQLIISLSFLHKVRSRRLCIWKYAVATSLCFPALYDGETHTWQPRKRPQGPLILVNDTRDEKLTRDVPVGTTHVLITKSCENLKCLVLVSTSLCFACTKRSAVWWHLLCYLVFFFHRQSNHTAFEKVNQAWLRKFSTRNCNWLSWTMSLNTKTPHACSVFSVHLVAKHGRGQTAEGFAFGRSPGKWTTDVSTKWRVPAAGWGRFGVTWRLKPFLCSANLDLFCLQQSLFCIPVMTSAKHWPCSIHAPSATENPKSPLLIGPGMLPANERAVFWIFGG